jgi:PAS domain S-box-containing protein
VFSGGPFKNLPIKQKLVVILLATTTAALLITGTGIVISDTLLFRRSMERDLSALAEIVGDNSTAALVFNDPRVATQTLSALRVRQHMVTACLYSADGNLFARYTRNASAAEACPPPLRDEIARTGNGEITVSHPVILDRRRIGTLVLLYDRGEITDRIRLFSAIVFAILILSGFIAFAVSSRLRAAIAIPIARLAAGVASVSESGDYSIRVPKDTGDELGVLVDSFNDMLRRIQSRDAEVRNARNSLETTLTSIGDAVLATDTQGRVVFANPVAQTLLGWRQPEIFGTHVEEVFRIINEQTRQRVENPVARVLREGQIAGLANHTILIARDGSEVPIDDSAAPIRENETTTGVVLVFRDITERRRAQQDAAYLAAIVESSDDAIIGKSPDGIIRTWNAGAERLYGYQAEEVIGRPMLELLPPDRTHEESEILERLRKGDRLVHFETVRRRKDGTLFDVSLTISPIRDRSGAVVGVSHVARDITAQKKTAEQIRQTQKLESLGVLAGGIAHDFNNLLTGIIGNASIVLDDLPRGSQTYRFIEAVIAASERAAALARQMLAYSGKGRFVVEQVNLSKRVRDILPLIKASIPSRIELRLNLSEQLPPIDADATQMEQLVMNVIINAAEAIPEDEHGALTVTTGRLFVDAAYARARPGAMSELKPGAYVLFEVADTGCGMDEATLARIFDPFFTTKFTGRGLGLAAVLGIVRGHQGAVEVQSVLGQGTVFRFLFPEAEAALEATAGEKQTEFADLRGAGEVLVVDDEQIVRDMAKGALERYGYTALVAEDGARGLDVFRRNGQRIRCVVLDLTMPVMGGEETVARLKQIRPDVPIILSSGYNEAQAVQRFKGKGLAGFLQKPYRAAALVEKVNRVIAQSSPISRVDSG